MSNWRTENVTNEINIQYSALTFKLIFSFSLLPSAEAVIWFNEMCVGDNVFAGIRHWITTRLDEL